MPATQGYKCGHFLTYICQRAIAIFQWKQYYNYEDIEYIVCSTSRKRSFELSGLGDITQRD